MHLHDMQRMMMLPAVGEVVRMMMAKEAARSSSFVANDDGGGVYLYSLLPPLQLLTTALYSLQSYVA